MTFIEQLGTSWNKEAIHDFEENKSTQIIKK